MFKFVVLLAVTGVLAIHQPNLAAMFWTIGIAVAHTIEETRGKLWIYFAQRADFDFLEKIPTVWGFFLIVFPALVLQCYAAYSAFALHEARGLALLIGLRIGDAVFSHVMPVTQGTLPNLVPGVPTQLNPGMPTAIIYLVDGAMLALLFNSVLASAPRVDVAFGFFAGAIFFASVLPVLEISAAIFRRILHR